MVTHDSQEGKIPQSKFGKGEWMKFTGLMLSGGVILVAIQMYVFMPRSEGEKAHQKQSSEMRLYKALSTLETTHQIEMSAALNKVRDGNISDNTKILKVIHENQIEIMHGQLIPRRKIKPMPAGLQIDN